MSKSTWYYPNNDVWQGCWWLWRGGGSYLTLCKQLCDNLWLATCVWPEDALEKRRKYLLINYLRTFKNLLLSFKANEMSLVFEESLTYTLITFRLTPPEWNDIENGGSLFVKSLTDHCGQSGNKNVYVWSGEWSPVSETSPGLLWSILRWELSPFLWFRK